MDSAIVEVLAATLSPDNAVRNQAEEKMEEVSKKCMDRTFVES